MPVSRKRKRPASSTTKPKSTSPFPDRRAMEAFMAGLVGGPDDDGLNAAQNLMWDAWDTQDRKRRIALANKALSLSPLCADAYVLLAEEQARTPAGALDLYRRGVEAGETALGKDTFTEDAGHFWGILETRPYMRARFGLVMCLRALGNRDEAVAHLQDMLRLNPNDNQGLRYVLLSLLLEAERDGDAAALLDRYPDDSGASWPWGTLLLSFRREGGDGSATRLALDTAMAVNGHVRDYLLGTKKIPVRLPDYISPGGEDEAIEYVSGATSAWANTAGALAWLAMASTSPPRRTPPRRPNFSVRMPPPSSA